MKESGAAGQADFTLITDWTGGREVSFLVYDGTLCLSMSNAQTIFEITFVVRRGGGGTLLQGLT
jgi:hypothetical protein